MKIVLPPVELTNENSEYKAKTRKSQGDGRISDGGPMSRRGRVALALFFVPGHFGTVSARNLNVTAITQYQCSRFYT